MAKSQRKFERITYKERVLIENRYCIDLKSIQYISKELERPPSAISREIGGKPRKGRGRYNADVRQRLVIQKRHKQGRKTKMNEHAPLKEFVIKKMKKGWSPEQISIRLPKKYEHDIDMRISYESIYQYVYAQIYREGHGRVKEGCIDLRGYLPRRHTKRAKKGFRKAQRVERESMLPSIEQRPKEVETRDEIGHWEGDTMESKKSPFRVKSINERTSGIVFFGKTKNGTAKECNKITLLKLSQIPPEYRKTLTQDRGAENYEYQTVQNALDIECYFAHSYCSYERGSNENTNGLFRRYFPKGTDFGKITDQEISRVEKLINSRPRKRLDGLTPYEVFYQMTGVALDS
jgi:IS30 family transposase